MENFESLATESFSYSWLTNTKPLYSFFDNNNDADDNHNPSVDDDQLFNFDFPLGSPQTAPVHADEIFSDGHIMPVYIDRSKTKYSKSAPPSPVPSRQFVPRKTQFPSLRKWPRRLFRGILGIMKPLVGCSRKSNRVDDFDRAEYEASPTCGKIVFYRGDKKAKSWNNSPHRSPSSYCSNNSRSCDVESSIRQAILYCKNSLEA